MGPNFVHLSTPNSAAILCRQISTDLRSRQHQQNLFECGGDDIETGDNNDRDIEAEADLFASTLLMPLDDFRRQVDGQPISFDLLCHCAAIRVRCGLW